MTPKQQIQALLNQLPADATFPEIQSHLNSYGGLIPHHAAFRPSPHGTEQRPYGGTSGTRGAKEFEAWQDIVSI